jgi:2-keto-4-pentenoate hydratase
MSLSQQVIEELANDLLKRELSADAGAALTAKYPDMDLDDAYRIQLYNVEAKVSRGIRIVGKKIGLTSRGMQKLAGIDQPDFGYLLSDMAVDAEEMSFSKYRLQRPRLEGELAFVLKQDLKGPNVTALDVLLATDYVAGAFEIIDSRIMDWELVKFFDPVADNASSALYALGREKAAVTEIDLALLGMSVYKNGELINSGIGAEAMDNPAGCVAWLANKLSRYGIGLHKGETILSGALVAAVDAAPGDFFEARFSKLGKVELKFVD